MNSEQKLRREIRLLLYIFMAGLLLSGITAFPLHTELTYANDLFTYFKLHNSLSLWFDTVYTGVDEVDKKYPFIAYGTDWLAYAHLILAVLFIGILKDPVKNIWILQFGMIACVGIFPLAFIAGSIRGIPFYWQLIDCSFGLFGGVVLWKCYRKVRILACLPTCAIHPNNL